MILSDKEWDLVVSFISGEANADEIKEMEGILSDPAKKKYVEELKEIWDVSPETVKYEKYNGETSFSQLMTMPANDSVVSNLRKTKIALLDVLKIAAIVVLVFGAVFTWILAGNKQEAGENTVVVRYGEQSQVTLSDGTNIWLNSGSKLTYPSSFNGKTREVKLEGEAYFDVKHDKKKLFVVNVGKIRVKVLGTAFNIKSYPGDNKIETTLIRGSVVIENTGRGENEAPIVLKPGEKATCFLSNVVSTPSVKEPEDKIVAAKQITIAKVDPLPITSWKEKDLVFDNTSMEEMATILERWFGIKVHLANDAIKNFRYKGKFSHNENIFQVLEVIKITSPVAYQYKDHEITIDLIK